MDRAGTRDGSSRGGRLPGVPRPVQCFLQVRTAAEYTELNPCFKAHEKYADLMSFIKSAQ